MRFIIAVILLLSAVLVSHSKKNPLTYQINGKFQDHYFDLIGEELHSRGIKQLPQPHTWWNISWCIYHAPQAFLRLEDHQRVNNLPQIKHLVGKDHLHRIMQVAKEDYGEEPFRFWPKGFNLEVPEQFQTLRRLFADAEARGEEAKTYIIKRPGFARGEGIHLVGTTEQVDDMLKEGNPCYPLSKTRPLAQEYIKDVLLLEGHKVTLRVYAVISSLDPLRIYILPNGLVRIASKEYKTDLASISDVFTHVDSYDINHVNEKEFDDKIKE